MAKQARLTTARWSDPPQGVAYRLLVTRYRPRGVRKGAEPWDRWEKRLAPSVELLDAYLGRCREGRKVVATDLEPIPFEALAARYREEMTTPEATAALAEVRGLLAEGRRVTLLCYCEDAAHCHRTLLRDLVLAQP